MAGVAEVPDEIETPWPVGDGETAALARAFDWARSPLGDARSWPAHRRAAVDIVLGSATAMVAMFGDDLVQVYNDAYSAMASARHPEGFGRPLHEVWPQYRAFNEPLIAAVRRGEARSMRNVRLTIGRHGAPQDAWFNLDYSPLRDAEGRVDGVLVAVVETTEDVRARAAQAESEARFSGIFEQAGVGIAQMDDHGRYVLVNDRFCDILGRSRAEMLALTWRDITHERDIALNVELFERLVREKVPFQIEKRYMRPNGAEVWVRKDVSPGLSPDGAHVFPIAVIQDVTEAKRLEEQRRLLINELNHRVKNTLAAVQAIAAQSLRNARSLADAGQAFEARLLALGRAQDMLLRAQWQSADIGSVVEAAIEPLAGGNRFTIAGPPLRVAAQPAMSLAMALHELAVNAVKYGSLSREGGRVRLSWAVEPDEGGPRFRLRWAEEGGPPVTPPGRRGFGSRLIEHGLARELGGAARIAFEPSGVVCTIDVPVPATTGVAA